MNWQELSTSSHYQTAVAVADALKRGATQEATEGIQELIDALARVEKRALRSQLTRLMVHVIKWISQPTHRSRSWESTIENARMEIEDIQEETPSLNREVINQLWARCFTAARKQAQAEMEAESPVTELTWGEVFEMEYKFGS